MSVTCDRSVVLSGSSGFLPNKTDRHDITEILLKVVLNTINQTNKYIWLKVSEESCRQIYVMEEKEWIISNNKIQTQTISLSSPTHTPYYFLCNHTITHLPLFMQSPVSHNLPIFMQSPLSPVFMQSPLSHNLPVFMQSPFFEVFIWT